MLKVILKEDVPGQGKKGDVLNVSEGFFRNFLLPKGKAVLANEIELKKLAEEKKKNQLAEDERNKKYKETKKKIEETQIEIKGKTSGKKKLFGSLTPKDIVAALSEKKIKILAKQVKFKTPIKELGEHEVEILLGKDLKANLKVRVTN